MRTVSATVGAEITLRDLDPGVISRLRRALRYPNPEYIKARMRGAAAAEHIEPYKYACIEGQRSITIPRGAVGTVKMILRVQRLRAVWHDKRSCGEPLVTALNLERGLRPYQQQGADAIARFLQGMIVLPCASGKTILGIGAIHQIGRDALVVVPTRDLVEQWGQDIQQILGQQPSIFGAGKKQLGPITIATKDALRYHRDADLSRFGFVVFDECHRIPSRTHQRLLRRIPARYRLGLTATPDRADGTSKLVRYSFGDTLLERSVADMVSGGWLVLPTVEAVYTAFQYNFPEDPKWIDYSDLNNALVRNEKRNEQIVKLVCAEPHETWLILSPSSKRHCRLLSSALQSKGINAMAVTGDLAKGKRRRALQSLRDGQLQVMCATSLADEGLNIKRLSRVVLALPQSSRTNTSQRLGRTMRPLGSKKPRVFDIVDIEVKKLRSRWQTRKSEYRKLGLEIQQCTTLSLFDTATA